ncbi:flagellar filament capping protein FliD [Alicyclobacillus mali (ex Roth et al. 2021)]|uniref:flagellar filament capping protein FliD n=1 Tax=Alicyclobacillus mali (ex Roth et al. 2021) TaxID=1123961 RepID=UPI001A8FC932|nr:flagellar filament capping protein FliD [Alicyclobacillus mali (ex Roth et al. 2021)]
MSISSASSSSTNSATLLQQLNTLSNPGGTGLPVSQYAQDMQTILQQELETPLQNQLSQLSSQQSALSSLQTALQTFQQATQTLASMQSWSTVTASSSNTNVFTATAQPGANPGTFQIQVMSLAQGQTDVMSSNSYQSSATEPSNFVGGQLIIQQSSGSGSATIQIAQGESLSDIASAINQQSSVTGVVASVIGSGSTYYLALSSEGTGQASSFSVSGSATGTGVGYINFQEQTVASDAQISIDGQLFSSPTNTFANYIQGVTINAVSVDTSNSYTLTIGQDTSGAEKAVETWMNAYNALIDTVNKDTAYTPAAAGSSSTQGTAGPLFGDPFATSLLQQLPASVSQVISTVQPQINSLSSIGIVIDPSTGHLEFQSASGFSMASGTLPDGQSMFEQALNNNPQAVQQLFGVVNTTASTAVPISGILGGVNNLLNTLLIGNSSGTGTAPIQGELNAISAQQSSIQNYLNLVNQQIQNQVQNYTNQLNQLNAVMQQAQAQMKELSSMFGTSSSSSTLP